MPRTGRSGVFPIEDIEASVQDRIVVISHVWPGITPMNVWDMRYDLWCQFAEAADEWVRVRQKEADGG